MINELKEVKEEMAEAEEQVKQELSETPAVEPISHNPEATQIVRSPTAIVRTTDSSPDRPPIVLRAGVR